MSVVEAKNINRSFLNGRITVDVLKGINISFEKATFNILMGPSGSGKTTLMNILGALDRPNSGDVYIEGKNISKASDHERDQLRRKKVGFIFQSVALISNMSAYENIDFSLRISGYQHDLRRKRVEECLNYVGLKKRMKHRPSELSGGEQQRVAIARALAKNPSIIFADEPTAELDTNTGLMMVKLFRDIVREQNVTIIMCTHDVSMMDVADNILMLEDGVITNE
jgi:putative ABC transport system ATP-binding protein